MLAVNNRPNAPDDDLPPWLQDNEQASSGDAQPPAPWLADDDTPAAPAAVSAAPWLAEDDAALTAAPPPAAPAQTGTLPPWLDEGAPAGNPGAFAQPEWLAGGDLLPDRVDSDATYDQWAADQAERARPKSVEEELPDLSTPAPAADEGPVGTKRSTSELPEWFLGMDMLDTSDAPEWFTTSDEPEAEPVMKPPSGPPPGYQPEPVAPPAEAMSSFLQSLQDTPLSSDDPYREDAEPELDWISEQPFQAQPETDDSYIGTEMDAFFQSLTKKTAKVITGEMRAVPPPPPAPESPPEAAAPAWDAERLLISARKPTPPQPAAVDDDDWLAAMRTPDTPPPAPTPPQPADADDDWLAAMRTPAAPPPAPTPPQPAAVDDDDPDLDLILQRSIVSRPQGPQSGILRPLAVRATGALPTPESEAQPEDPGTQTWLSELESIVSQANRASAPTQTDMLNLLEEAFTFDDFQHEKPPFLDDSAQPQAPAPSFDWDDVPEPAPEQPAEDRLDWLGDLSGISPDEHDSIDAQPLLTAIPRPEPPVRLTGMLTRAGIIDTAEQPAAQELDEPPADEAPDHFEPPIAPESLLGMIADAEVVETGDAEAAGAISLNDEQFEQELASAWLADLDDGASGEGFPPPKPTDEAEGWQPLMRPQNAEMAFDIHTPAAPEPVPPPTDESDDWLALMRAAAPADEQYQSEAEPAFDADALAAPELDWLAEMHASGDLSIAAPLPAAAAPPPDLDDFERTLFGGPAVQPASAKGNPSYDHLDWATLNLPSAEDVEAELTALTSAATPRRMIDILPDEQAEAPAKAPPPAPASDDDFFAMPSLDDLTWEPGGLNRGTAAFDLNAAARIDDFGPDASSGDSGAAAPEADLRDFRFADDRDSTPGADDFDFEAAISTLAIEPDAESSTYNFTEHQTALSDSEDERIGDLFDFADADDTIGSPAPIVPRESNPYEEGIYSGTLEDAMATAERVGEPAPMPNNDALIQFAGEAVVSEPAPDAGRGDTDFFREFGLDEPPVIEDRPMPESFSWGEDVVPAVRDDEPPAETSAEPDAWLRGYQTADEPLPAQPEPEFPPDVQDLDSYLRSLRVQTGALKPITASLLEPDSDLESLLTQQKTEDTAAPKDYNPFGGAQPFASADPEMVELAELAATETPEWLKDISVNEVSATAIVRKQQDKPESELDERLQRLRSRAATLPQETGVAEGDLLEQVVPGLSGALAPARLTATGGIARGEILLTPEQLAHVEMLSSLVAAATSGTHAPVIHPPFASPGAQPVSGILEPAAAASPRRRRIAVPDRLLVAVLLLGAMLLPFILRPARIGSLPPASFAADPAAQAAFDTLDRLPPGAVVLVGMEYAPGSAAELDAAADALLRHILMRRAYPVIISANPLALARADILMDTLAHEDALLQAVGSSSPLQANRDYFLVRNLPGGAIGLRAFSSDMARLITNDLRGQVTGLQITTLRDFAAIAVVTDRLDDLRAYVEQIAPEAQAPVLALVSYGIAPLAQPYVSGLPDGALAGMIAGYGGAYTYHQLLGMDAPAPESAPVALPEGERPAPLLFTPSPTATPSPTLTPSPTATPTPPPPELGVINSSQSVNIRALPSDTADIIGQLAPGTQVRAIGLSEEGTWVNIVLDDGTYGWVFRQLVRLPEGAFERRAPSGQRRQAPGRAQQSPESPTPGPGSTRTPRPSFTPARTTEALAEVTPEATPETTPAASPGYRDERWFSITAGLIASAAIIAIGALVNIVRSIARRRRSQ